MTASSNSSSSPSPSTSPPPRSSSSSSFSSPFSLVSDDLLLSILAKLEPDPRDWARLACVSRRLSALIRCVCCRHRCARSLPSDLLPSAAGGGGGWASLHKLSVCCPGLFRAGVLLEHSDFGLEREIGPDRHLLPPPHIPNPNPNPPTSTDSAPPPPNSTDPCWSLFDDLYLDTVYDRSESLDPSSPPPNPAAAAAPRRGDSCRKRKPQLRPSPVEAHLASGSWTLSREQGNKLLASRFRDDCLYICNWPGCIHAEEKRKYMLFRGVFKNFKRSRVWRTISDSNRGKIGLDCAFCGCKDTWDLHSAFCLRSFFGFHDDGEPVVRAFVCENGHVSGAWTERPMYTCFWGGRKKRKPKKQRIKKRKREKKRRRKMRVVVVVFLELILAVMITTMIMVGNGEQQNGPTLLLSADDFPRNFIFGSGTSAYQVEGAAAEDGRSPSVWDTFAHAGYMRGTGDIAADEYHKYKEDVKLMKETGLDAYRFSISWSRLIPNGRGEVNPKAIEYYNNLVNELLNHGIKPHVTLFHYDLPQVLEDEYEGWLSPKIVDDFTAYADVCFREFGDRVSHWTTLNEPNVLALLGYDVGFAPPKRCSHPFGNCSRGNSPTEPYIVAHHCLLAHSSAVSLYNRKYKAKQQGFIGINIFVYYFLPLTNSTNDIIATKRARDFYVGWFVEPLYRGDYPETMRKMVGSKLPKFSRSQSEQLTGSYDFISLNYYAAMYVKDDPHDIPASQRDFVEDMFAVVTDNGLAKSGSLFPVVPSGLNGVLEYFKQSYGNPPIYIHENGFAMPQNGSLDDVRRVKYISEHLKSLLTALRNGSNTLGYFTWSFIDAYELLYGYEYSYGLYYVDFEDEDRRRYPRLSAKWYSRFLRGRNHISLMNSSPNSIPLVSTT